MIVGLHAHLSHDALLRNFFPILLIGSGLFFSSSYILNAFFAYEPCRQDVESMHKSNLNRAQSSGRLTRPSLSTPFVRVFFFFVRRFEKETKSTSVVKQKLFRSDNGKNIIERDDDECVSALQRRDDRMTEKKARKKQQVQ